MTAATRNALWAALVMSALAATACGGPPSNPPDSGVDGGDGTCIEDTDCPDPQLFFCNTTTSTCEPSCRTREDCGATRRGQYALDYCAGSLGCQCDEGKCVGSLCSADVDCGSQVCRNGQCVAPPAASTVAKCQITPDSVILKSGAKAKFWVSAWNAANEPVIVKDGATWSALGGVTTLSGSANGNSAEFTAATTTNNATDAVQAAFGTVTCKAKALVLSPPAAGRIGVVVFDELSNRPIPAAKVMLTTSAGAVIQQAGQDTVDTGANGFAEVNPGANTTVTVSVFHTGFNYLTVANYTGNGPDANFLALALRRNQLDKYGGYKGTFTSVPATSNVHAGIAGMSLAGSITNLSLTQLLGPSVPTDIVIGSAINQQDVPIPAGAYLGFGDQQIKTNVAGLGLAGTCVDGSGNPDETKIAAGTCGTRTAWALAGDIPLGDLPIDAFAGGVNNINIGQLLSRIIPIFKKFNSSVVRDVQFDLQPTPCTSGGTPPCLQDDYNFTNDAFFTPKNHVFTQVPLAFSFAVKLPDVPQFRGTYADGVALIGGANAPGRGVVPLGLGIGVNTNPVDAKTDVQANLPAAGLVQMRMAPTHHGLEGNEYGIVAAALSAKSLTDASSGLALSAIFARVSGNKLVFDPSGATPVDISAQAFPVFPEGAKYNFVDVAQGALAARTFKFASALTGVGVVRVSFGDAYDQRWDVLLDAAQATTGFVLPKPPGTLRDRTFATGLQASGRSTMLVQAFKLNTAPAGTTGTNITFNGLVELNSNNLDRVTDFLQAFSLMDYAPPKVSFKTPNANPATVAKGSKLVTSVSSFKVGAGATDDGVVKFTFTSGGNPAAGCPEATVATEVQPGNGEVEYTLPMTCTGTSISVRAQLMQPNGAAPVLPDVAATTVITVNP